MNLWQAVILGVVEGLTEFLPISSTGHLILAAKLFNLQQTEFMKSFEIAIQTGAILAVVVLYGKRVLASPKIWGKIIAAFVPTAVLGLIFYDTIKRHLMADEKTVLWALFLGGIFIILFEHFHREKENASENIEAMPWKLCIGIGFFQALALVPGVSRAGATILGGLFLGLRRKTIVEFSFLLAVPTLLAATALDLVKSAPVFGTDELMLLAVGFASSFIVAILAIELFLMYVRKNSFTLFGVYRIVLSLVFWVYLFGR